jgi:hypothetical protein
MLSIHFSFDSSGTTIAPWAITVTIRDTRIRVEQCVRHFIRRP